MEEQPDLIATRVLLGFLRAGRVLDGASSVLLLGTFGLVLVVPAGPLAAGISLALALGLLAKYLAWRVALDAEFFALLNEEPARAADFDAALAAFLGREAEQSAGAGRSMQSRRRGARRLVRQQAAAVVAQALLVLLLAGLVALGREAER